MDSGAGTPDRRGRGRPPPSGMSRLEDKIDSLQENVANARERLSTLEEWKRTRDAEPPLSEITNRLTSLETQGESKKEGVTRKQWFWGLVVVLVATLIQVLGNITVQLLSRSDSESTAPTGSGT